MTGTQVLLLVVSETGLVYTFTTPKLQPLVTQPEGKNLIQVTLSSDVIRPDTGADGRATGVSQRAERRGPQRRSFRRKNSFVLRQGHMLSRCLSDSPVA